MRSEPDPCGGHRLAHMPLPLLRRCWLDYLSVVNPHWLQGSWQIAGAYRTVVTGESEIELFTPPTLSVHNSPFIKPASAKSRVIRWLPLLCIGLLLASGCAGTRGRADQELFPQLDGWKRARRIAVYTALDLSEYTAAAGFYRSYGFQDLQVKRYRRRGGYSVVAEVYRQATDDLAFGIYSQERPAHGPFLDLGGQGYAKRGGVYFFSGPYYVKIHSAELPSGSPVLTALASAMAERLGPAGGLPELFAVFPEQAKIRYSEMLVSEQFMGYDFFDEVYATDYSRGEFTYRMFIKPCATGSAASAVVQAYLNEIGDRRKLSGKSMFVLRDPFHGEVQMQIFGRYLVGVSGIEGQSLQEEFRRMGEQLVKTDF